MRLLGVDCETTGLDVKTERITELGAVLWDTDMRAPVWFFSHFLFDDSIETLLKSPEKVRGETRSEMVARISGFTLEFLQEFGRVPYTVFSDLDHFCENTAIDYIVAHNGRDFDIPLLAAEMDRHGVKEPRFTQKTLVDTKYDLPWKVQPDSLKLKHLAMEANFINPFPHRAVTDVLTMFKVLDQFPIEEVVEFMKIPSQIIRAMVPHPKNDQGKGKDLAKAAGFRWQEIGYKRFDNCWVKLIKVNKLEEEKARLPGYEVVVIG